MAGGRWLSLIASLPFVEHRARPILTSNTYHAINETVFSVFFAHGAGGISAFASPTQYTCLCPLAQYSVDSRSPRLRRRPPVPPRFGEVAHAPPDLAKIPKPRGFKDQGQAKPWARQAAANASDGGGGGGNGAPSDGNSGGVKQSHQQLKKKGRRDSKAAAGGKEEEQEEKRENREEQRRMAAEAKKARKRQMEEMRQRVQEAYSGLKKKRRAGQTQFVGSDL